MAREKTRGERNIAWIEKYCRVPEGKFVGQPVKMRPWQRSEICKIYDNPNGTRRGILSFGRKNGKTALASFLLLLHLCGPEARANSQLYSAAQSRDQAAILFGLAAKTVRLSADLSAVIIIRDTRKELYCGELGTLYRALSAEASTAYGLSPVFIVHDELGQVRGPRSELYEALETATAAQDSPLSIVISTQAPNGPDLLSMLIDDAVAGHDPRVVVSLYTAPESFDPFGVEAIKAANPAFGDFQNADEVLAMAADAERMPSREAEYRNLILNQRVEMNSPLIPKAVWHRCRGETFTDFRGKAVYAGLDLSETNDLTALVLIADFDGVWHTRSKFWLPEEGLAERSKRDRVPYDVWAKQGLLSLTPGRSVEYEFVAKYLCELFLALDIQKIAFDRWNFKHLKAWLVKAGLSEAELERFVEFGQGFASMSPAIRDLESDLLNEKIRHGDNPILNMCAANAIAQIDPAGNRKIAKHKSKGRVDGIVCLTMARAVAAMNDDDDNRRFISGRVVVL